MPNKLKAQVARNGWLTCVVPGCQLPRHKLERWCRGHTTTGAKYGHPLAKPIKPTAMTAERVHVKALLEANQDHPGQQQVLHWLTNWVARANASLAAFKGAEEVQRLTGHGITPFAMLAELCTTSLYLKRNPRAVPDDRSWDYALARAIFGLAPRERRTTKGPSGFRPVTVKLDPSRSYSIKAKRSALGFVGSHLRQSLAPFIANVLITVESYAEKEDELQKALKAPLRLPFARVATHP